MKLQKLCYYCQAWSLVWDDNELFPEEFVAWKNGPVCRELFSRTQEQFRVSENDEPGNPDLLTDDQKDTINKVIKYYGKHDAQWLSRLTHMEDPWLEARGSLGNDSYLSQIVTKDSMSKYYSAL